MEVQFSASTEAQRKQLAASEGKEAARLVEETMARVLKRRAEFLEGVDRRLCNVGLNEFARSVQVHGVHVA